MELDTDSILNHCKSDHCMCMLCNTLKDNTRVCFKKKMELNLVNDDEIHKNIDSVWDVKDPSEKRSEQDSSRSPQSKMYHDFVDWLNSKNVLMEQLQSGKGRHLTYEDYVVVKEEFDRQLDVLERLRSLVIHFHRSFQCISIDTISLLLI